MGSDPRRIAFAVVAAAFGVSGCGSVSAGPALVLDAGADAIEEPLPLFPPNLFDGAPSPICPVACPPTEPTDGTPCTLDGVCRYGTDPRVSCRTDHRCEKGVWHTLPLAASCNLPTSSASCPSSMPVDQTACSTTATCFYPDGECRCYGPKWDCEKPLTRGCPMRHPDYGQRCPEGLVCRYPSTPCTWMECECGVWSGGAIPCE